MGPRCPFSEATVTKAACLFEKSSSLLSPVPQRRNVEGNVCQRTRADAFYPVLLYSEGETERGVMWNHLKVNQADRSWRRKMIREKNEYSNLINVLNQWVSRWMASFRNYSWTLRCGTAAHWLHPSSRSTQRLQLSAIPEANLRTLQKPSVVTKANRLGAQHSGWHRGGSGGNGIISRYHGDFLRHWFVLRDQCQTHPAEEESQKTHLLQDALTRHLQSVR